MKKLLSFLMAAALLLSLAACQSEPAKVTGSFTFPSFPTAAPTDASRETEEPTEPTQEETTEPTQEETTEPTQAETQAPTQPQTGGISPEFKATMDGYEAFFDEYVEFMRTYQTTDNPLLLAVSYGEMMVKYTQTMSQLQALENQEMTTEEAIYYSQVMARINQKLLQVA